MIFYTITVDTEEEWDWNSPFTSDRGKLTNIAGIARFQAISEKYGASVTYFTNYSVISDRNSAAVIGELNRNAMAEIGLHCHPWNTPPLATEVAIPENESFLANLPWAIARSKLDSVLSRLADLGISPKSYRGGRYSTSDQIQEYLSSQGISADCSILPYTTWDYLGAPNYLNRDHQINRKEFQGGKLRIWEIPLTRGFTRFNWDTAALIYRWFDKPALRAFRLIGIMERLNFVRRVWLNFEQNLGRDIQLLIPVLKKSNLRAINFTLHSSSLVPAKNGYVKTPRDLEIFYQNLDRTLSTLQSDNQFQSTTVNGLTDILDRE